MVILQIPTKEAFGIVFGAGQTKDITIIRLLSRDDLKVIQRSMSFPPKQGNWFKSPDGSVTISCPKCERLFSLIPKVNKIDPDDGCVSPSVICPHPNCGYHEWIRLHILKKEVGT